MSKFSVNTPTIGEYKAIFSHYASQGWTDRGTSFDTYGSRTKLYIDNVAKKITFSSTSKKQKEGVPAISFAQFSAVTGATVAAPRTATMQVGDYSATINYDNRKVEIHGQFIDFSVIEQLGDLLDA